jgi:hypothetical protein
VVSGVEGEGFNVVWFDGITNETTSGVGVEAKHEEEGKMMCIPESLETLLPDLSMRGSVHDDHDEEHEVSGNATCLSVMDLERCLLTNLSSLNVDEINIMSGGVNHSPERHGISDLSVEPNVLIGGEEPSEFGTNDTDDISQHWEQDETSIEREDQAGTSRNPN